MASISLFTTTSTESYGNSATSATTQQTSTQATTQSKTADAKSTQTQTADTQDTVKLSQAGQAKMLYKQGQSVTAIAADLGTTSKAVNDLLGITLQKELTKTLEATAKAG